MKLMPKRHQKHRNHLLLIAVAVLLIAGVGTFFVVRSHAGAANDVRKPNSVDYGPPTEQEKKETEAFKEQQQKQNGETPAPAPKTDSGKLAVTPVISYVGQYDASIEASGFVPSIFENGGTCTLTLTHGSTTVTKTSAGSEDARTTRCQTFSFPARELKPVGTWTAVLSYSSPTSEGSSSKVDFEVK
jgi:hypothetical protein